MMSLFVLFFRLQPNRYYVSDKLQLKKYQSSILLKEQSLLAGKAILKRCHCSQVLIMIIIWSILSQN